MATKKNTPNWSDVKTRLTDFDRTGLLGLLQDLYAANKDNQAFLHARHSLGDDDQTLPKLIHSNTPFWQSARDLYQRSQ